MEDIGGSVTPLLPGGGRENKLGPLGKGGMLYELLLLPPNEGKIKDELDDCGCARLYDGDGVAVGEADLDADAEAVELEVGRVRDCDCDWPLRLLGTGGGSESWAGTGNRSI